MEKEQITEESIADGEKSVKEKEDEREERLWRWREAESKHRHLRDITLLIVSVSLLLISFAVLVLAVVDFFGKDLVQNENPVIYYYFDGQEQEPSTEDKAEDPTEDLTEDGKKAHRTIQMSEGIIVII